MTDKSKNKNLSPLVQSVLALDEVFSNLTQLSARIDGLNLKSSLDFDQAEKLIARFAEIGESVTSKIGVMSQALNEARQQAEAAAVAVTTQAEAFQARRNEIQAKMDEFRALGEKVNVLTASLGDLQGFIGQTVSEETRMKMTARLVEVESMLRPLIDEAQRLKEVAQDSKIKILEQGADSMRQSLMAVKQKITGSASAPQGPLN